MSLRRLQLDTSWGPLSIVGGSRAGEGSLTLLPQLKIALDPGRPHRGLPPMRSVFISHGHIDHLGGLAFWASQRQLNTMGAGTVIAAAEIADDVSRLLELHAKLEGGLPYPAEVVPVSAESIHSLRADMSMRFFRTDHWVPTLGTTLVWKRRRLLPELAGEPGEEIAQRRRAGHEVTEECLVDLLSYCADSGPAIFEDHPELTTAEVLMVECSFYRDSDRDRAGRYGHTHLDDLKSIAGSLSCRHLIVLHASRRHRLREVEAVLDSELRPLLSCNLDHLIVDWP